MFYGVRLLASRPTLLLSHPGLGPAMAEFSETSYGIFREEKRGCLRESMDTNVTFQRLSGRYQQEAVKYLIHEEKDGHVCTRTSFAWLVSIKCSNPVESLLEMIAN